jgi:7-cyano-7-deazaguanine reductase
LTDDLTLLGAGPVGAIAADRIETIAVTPSIRQITITTAELTAKCPVTDQPDLYTATITYQPDGRCVESKSLKLYLHGYRDMGIFAEHLAAQICDDLADVLAPGWLSVVLTQATRGGLSLTVQADHNRWEQA